MGKLDRIAIITDFSPESGAGHILRMATLLKYLNYRKPGSTVLISSGFPDSFPKDLKRYTAPELDFYPDLIIRDFRDSATEKIAEYKQIAPTLVIDDNGTGRKLADWSVDLLPNPQNKGKYSPEFFIFGYNFWQDVVSLKGRQIEKQYDFAIYPGPVLDNRFYSDIMGLLPEKSRAVFLLGDDSFVLENLERAPLPQKANYAELLLSANNLITHFGITLFEGRLCNSRVFTINPTKYHSQLTDYVTDKKNIFNLGTTGELDHSRIMSQLVKLQLKTTTPHPTEFIERAIIANLDNFYKYLLTLSR